MTKKSSILFGLIAVPGVVATVCEAQGISRIVDATGVGAGALVGQWGYHEWAIRRPAEKRGFHVS